MSFIFNLDPISTKGKPGKLININFEKICKNNNIYFQPNHQFYINDLNSIESRGNHSNSNCNEMLICLNGCFDIKLFDGKFTKNYNITQNMGIYIPINNWIEISNFKNSIIIVFTEIFNNKESIYDFEEFKKKFTKI